MSHAARFRLVSAATALFAVAAPVAATEDATSRALTAIKAVGREGKGNAEAAAAWRVVVDRGVPALLPTLEAMADADPVAANWLRTAVGAIVENHDRGFYPVVKEHELPPDRRLPADALAKFVRNPAQHPQARLLAYETLAQCDPSAARRLDTAFLDDPCLELRRRAVQHLIDSKPVRSEGDDLRPQYRLAFGKARDKDQVEALAGKLAALGDKPSVTEHFGYVTHWHLVGPFPNPDGTGLGTAYPPETAVDLTGKLKGTADAELTWKPTVTTDRYATVDVNKVLGKNKDAVAYAVATVASDAERPVEVRVASQNAVQIWLNGTKLFERDEYHHGTRMDQHVGKGSLKAGPNVVMLKVCQNAQTEGWAQAWGFQCRLCDGTGGAAAVTQLVPTAGGQPMPIALGYTPAAAEDKK